MENGEWRIVLLGDACGACLLLSLLIENGELRMGNGELRNNGEVI